PLEFRILLLLIALVIILLLFSAFFSGTETALFSLSRSAVAEMKNGPRRKRMVASILSQPRMLLVTILFGNLLVNIANTSLVTVLAIKFFGPPGVGYTMIFMTFLILICGEISPKSLALKYAASLAVTVVPVMKIFMTVFYPVRFVLGKVADLAVDKSRQLFGESQEEYGFRDLATAVEMGYGDGLFDDFEREILTNLFLLEETMAREILTPRVEVFSLDVNSHINDAIIQVKNHGFSRVPVYEDRPDNIVGILMAKTLLSFSRDEKTELRAIMRGPRFVPETKKVRDLLGELITEGQHVVIVIDEHGSFAGIVTLEDILEEIFGEIRDRREPRVDEFNLIDKDRVIVEGTMRLEDFNEIFGTRLQSKEVETVAGYLIEEVEKIPREGETFILDNMRFLVLSADATKVNKIKIERVEREKEADE
ncbi:MAG: HlyC/CorC family transporter, partial [Candidatus Krumholzibacteriota bacterium]|nr:HlyC/CorC family transporter [Candidatus Krumholzibacteriota bacterium]